MTQVAKGNPRLADPAYAREIGARGTPERERRVQERLGETREALSLAAPHAARTLVELLDAENEHARLSAANSVLDRVLGQSTAHVVYEHSAGIDAAIEELIGQLEQSGGDPA